MLVEADSKNRVETHPGGWWGSAPLTADSFSRLASVHCRTSPGSFKRDAHTV